MRIVVSSGVALFLAFGVGISATTNKNPLHTLLEDESASKALKIANKIIAHAIIRNDVNLDNDLFVTRNQWLNYLEESKRRLKASKSVTVLEKQEVLNNWEKATENFLFKDQKYKAKLDHEIKALGVAMNKVHGCYKTNYEVDSEAIIGSEYLLSILVTAELHCLNAEKSEETIKVQLAFANINGLKLLFIFVEPKLIITIPDN